ncbi:MAG: RuvA C-terminal domain-containing protein [Candidatus Woesearchaeota archaeon]
MREDYKAFSEQTQELVKLDFRGYQNYAVFVRNPRKASHPVFIDSHLVKSVLELIAQQSGLPHTKVEEAKRIEEMKVVEIIKGGRGSHAPIYGPNGKDVIEALVNLGYQKQEKH